MAWAIAGNLFQGFEDGTNQAKTTLNRAQLDKLLTVPDQKFEDSLSSLFNPHHGQRPKLSRLRGSFVPRKEKPRPDQ